MNCLITYMFMDLGHENKDRVQVPQRNKMVRLNCTALGFIGKNEEYNCKWNIHNGRYLKNLISQKVVKQ